ncbi:hypothetical protein ES707_02125 [subsurface metagenome]
MSQQDAYPLHFKGELTVPPGSGLWLIKWLLAIPHFFILFFLWIGFVVAWVIALFAIVFTSKYPRGLFDYNVGVLRWSWRVGFYSYEVLGTDKYPPFTLKSVADYPADLEVEYPERLSPGLALVKWWLLAIPHYIVVGTLAGGWQFREGWQFHNGWEYQGGGSLIFALVIIAAVALLFTGRYHQDIFRLVMGMNRWVYRVAVYAALMTDKYPPFRLWD